MLNRLLYAFRAFKFSWNNYQTDRDVLETFHNWMAQENSFKVGKHVYSDGYQDRFKNIDGLDDATLLKKRCVNDAGEVRYFDVVPDGWRQVTANS